MNIFLEKIKIDNNKYYKWYSNIVERALSRELPKDVYVEKHHILPKCLYPEYAKDKNNLVKLTAREHFVCHWILSKIFNDRKIMYAFEMMFRNKTTNRYLPKSSTIYANLRKKFSSNKRGKSGKSWYTNGVDNVLSDIVPEGFIPGRTFSTEHKNSLKGIPKSEEHKKKQSASMMGKPGIVGDKNPSKRPEVKAKIAQSRLGKTASQDTKNKMSSIKVGKKRGPYKTKSKVSV